MTLRGTLKWFNQKIGNFFGDFKEDRELNEEAGVWRDIIRVLCLLGLLGGFAYAFYRLFMEAPSIRVKRVYLDGKNSDFATSRLYNSSASYGTDVPEVVSTEIEVIDCPCMMPTISWVEHVHFYTIDSTFVDPVDGSRILTFPANGSSPLEVLYRVPDLGRYISRGTDNLNATEFCWKIELLPRSLLSREFQIYDCLNVVTALFSTIPRADFAEHWEYNGRSFWSNPRASYFESPSLLSQKFLYSNTIRRLHAYQQDQYTVQMTLPPENGENATLKEMFMSGMADLWLNTLDAFGSNSSITDLDFFIFSAQRVWNRSIEVRRYHPMEFTVLLNNGTSFLGMDVNWTDYYNACKPAFCDVTTQNTAFRRTYTTLAQVGGLWGFAVVALTLIVWPVIAFLLVHCRKCCTSPTRKLSRYTSLAKPEVNAEVPVVVI